MAGILSHFTQRKRKYKGKLAGNTPIKTTMKYHMTGIWNYLFLIVFAAGLSSSFRMFHTN